LPLSFLSNPETRERVLLCSLVVEEVDEIRGLFVGGGVALRRDESDVDAWEAPNPPNNELPIAPHAPVGGRMNTAALLGGGEEPKLAG
jgi:hypothetical protein